MRCDMKDPCHAPTPQWGGRKGTAAGCRPSDVACWLPQRAQRAYLSAQTRPKISHHTEALLKVASVCAVLQHFWGKLIVCLLHMGWAETKNKTVQDTASATMDAYTAIASAASAAVTFASRPGIHRCRAAAAQARVCRRAGACPAGQLGHVRASLPCRAPGLRQLLRCCVRLRGLRLCLNDAPGQGHCHRWQH